MHPELANPPPPPSSARHNAALTFILAPFRSRSRTPSASSSEAGDDAHPPPPALLPSDLLHSTAYIPYLTSHLQKTFPSVPAAVLKSFIADEVPYRELRRRLEEWKETRGRGWRGFWGRLGGGGASERGKGKGKARTADEEEASEDDVRELIEAIDAWDVEQMPSYSAPVVLQREIDGKAGPSRPRSISGGSSSTDDAELYPEADDLPLPELPPWPSSSNTSLAAIHLKPEAPTPSSVPPLLQPEPAPTEPDLECQCCFSDLLVPSSSSTTETTTISCLSRTHTHLFCAPCLRRQVEEHLFGGAPLALDSNGLGREQGVRCMSMSGCRAGFEARELRRVLGGKRWRMLERRVAEAALEALVAGSRAGGRTEEGGSVEGGRRIIRCPAEGCPYAEEREDPNPFSLAFPFWTSPLAAHGLWWSAQGVDALFFSLYSATVLIFLHLFVLLFVFLLPHRFAPPPPQPPLFPLIEPHRALRATRIWIHDLAVAVLARKEGAPNLLRCRNTPNGQPLKPFGDGVEELRSLKEVKREVWPCLSTRWRGGAGSATALVDEDGEEEGEEEEQLYCGLIICLLCSAPVMPERGAHRCYSEEKDGLRLAVERARSEAVKRVCGRCGLSFVKEGGCNKVSSGISSLRSLSAG